MNKAGECVDLDAALSESFRTVFCTSHVCTLVNRH